MPSLRDDISFKNRLLRKKVAPRKQLAQRLILEGHWNHFIFTYQNKGEGYEKNRNYHQAIQAR